MKYKISDLYIEINNEPIPIGAVLGEEDNPNSPFRSGYITITEYENGLKNFTYGKQRIDDLMYHCLGKYYTTGESKSIKRKWVEELSRLGYDVSKVKFLMEDEE